MIRIPAILLACLLSSASAVAAGGGLDVFLHDLNVHARANPEGFSATLRSQFHVSGSEVAILVGGVHDPADAFMILQLGQMSRQPTHAVMRIYQQHQAGKGKGWGAIAKALGIKPGSAAFHALKRGDFHFGSPPASRGGGAQPGHGRGKGKHGR
jgi:hypothetical protein